MDAAAIFNLAEAALWTASGIALAAARGSAGFRRMKGLAALSAVLFLLFGLSDLAEVRTGAWWRPSWLLAWKAVNGLALVICVGAMYSIFRKDREER